MDLGGHELGAFGWVVGISRYFAAVIFWFFAGRIAPKLKFRSFFTVQPMVLSVAVPVNQSNEPWFDLMKQCSPRVLHILSWFILFGLEGTQTDRIFLWTFPILTRVITQKHIYTQRKLCWNQFYMPPFFIVVRMAETWLFNLVLFMYASVFPRATVSTWFGFFENRGLTRCLGNVLRENED